MIFFGTMHEFGREKNFKYDDGGGPILVWDDISQGISSSVGYYYLSQNGTNFQQILRQWYNKGVYNTTTSLGETWSINCAKDNFLEILGGGQDYVTCNKEKSIRI